MHSLLLHMFGVGSLGFILIMFVSMYFIVIAPSFKVLILVCCTLNQMNNSLLLVTSK